MKALRRFLTHFRCSKLDREMDDELRFHIEEQTRRNVAAGMSLNDAAVAARRQFGWRDRIREEAREARGWTWLENVLRDVRHALRALHRSPGFTSVVVLTLGLGIGVNAALFTWFNAAAFRTLPMVRQADQLVALVRLDEHGNETGAMSYTDFVTYRDHQTVLSGLAASAGWGVEALDTAESTAASGEGPVGFHIETVSTNYFAVFDVPIALGRPLAAEDEGPSGALPVMVISHHFWQSYFGGDPNVVGRTLRLRGLAGEALTIVGVAAEEFHGTRPGALAGWVPLAMRPGDDWRTDLKATNFSLTGRLRPGISREQAAEELEMIANAFLARPHAGPVTSETIILTGASTYIKLTARHTAVLLPMICLFGAVFVVSCANASNLILARTVTRQFELAVRSALGASRRRLFSLLMSESLVLGLLGGFLGWGVSAGLLQIALPWLLDMVPGAREGTAGLNLHADHRVFAFTLIVSLVAGVAGGLFPALQVTRCDVVPALNRDTSAFGRGLRLSRIRGFLAVTQLALSSALVFTAGLLAHRALRTQFQDVGFDKSRLVTLEVLAPRTHEPGQLDTARRQVLDRLRALPDVAAVSELPRFPFAPRTGNVSVPTTEQAGDRTVEVIHTAVPADYFATLQLPILRGRPFATHESATDCVAVISETAARQFWPNEDALGQRFEIPSSILTGGAPSDTRPTEDASPPRTTVTVVGIAREARVYDPWNSESPVIYLPLAPQTTAAPYLLVRTHKPVSQSLAAFQQVGRDVTSIDPRLITVDDVFASAFGQYRVFACAGGILAALSLIVAVIGLHGVMSFAVNQRVKEIGVRMALGASPGRVLSGIVLESLRLVAVGAVAGYGLSVLVSKIARNLLFGVSALDPLAAGVVLLFLAIVSVVACWAPARRAAKVEPMVALRSE